MSLEEKRINTTSHIMYLARTVRKVRKDKRMAKGSRNNQEISLRTIESAESVRRLIHSLNLSLEEKVAMEDQINELSHKSDCLLDIISSSNRNYRQKLFLAYRDFLERNFDVVNERIDEL
jgi:hypothetical protein